MNHLDRPHSALTPCSDIPHPYHCMMASDIKETERSERNAVEEVFEFYHDSGDELNTDEEEDGNFYDGYLDQNNLSRSLTPSPNIQDEEFHEDSDECVGALALPTPAQLEDRLHSIQSKKRSRSSTVTLKNMYGREPGNSDSDGPESEDEEAQSQSSGSPDWEL
ncbi:hypothetical protein BYT27DRAFT_7188600 [Phlegmacium glaucopus]|nr:hypothetical protein BYT27DRAFT_7188600 [Phlegmacium glaucopus]